MRFPFVSGLLVAALPVAVLAAPADNDADSAFGPVVVTATATPTPQAKVGSSISVITREDIKRSQAATVTDLLKRVAGIHMAESGGPGGQTSIFMRGTNSNHVLVLIDGVEASDPSNPTGQFDFANLRLDNIERIEVVRGPQSVLYGSDAIGGVIQIFTKHADKDSQLHWRARTEAGSQVTTRGDGGVSYGGKQVQSGVSYSFVDTAGISAASSGSEKDAYKNLTLGAYINSQPTDNTYLNARVRRSQGNAEIDNYSTTTFAFGDDADASVRTKHLTGSVTGGLSLLNDAWEQRLRVSLDKWKRESINGTLPNNTTANNDAFEGKKTQINWQHNLRLGQTQNVVLGLEHEKNEADTAGLPNASVDNNAAYLQYQLAGNSLPVSSTLGVRYDDHEKFGGHFTWRATGKYRVAATGTGLHASYGTSFKAPTLYQLFDNSFGSANPNLNPEESNGWDVGIEQALLGEAIHVGLTYFYNDIDNLIGFNPVTFKNINIGSAKTQGVEFEVRAQLMSALLATLNYTHTKAEDRSTGKELLRRPKDMANLSLDWKTSQQLSLGLGAHYVGTRLDYKDFAHPRYQLDPYTVLTTRATWHFNPNWRLEGRIENLLDEDYENVYGFGTSGRAYYVALAIDY